MPRALLALFVALTQTGSAWSQCGFTDTGGDWGPIGDVHHFVSHDDGSGEKLFAAGIFPQGGSQGTMSISAFDGQLWRTLPNTQPFGGDATGLVEFDDGTGKKLYVAGLFSCIGPSHGLENIARFDGHVWRDVDGGLIDPFGIEVVDDLHVHDDGTGPALFACGIFAFAGSSFAPALNIARWDGSQWSGLGSGLTGSIGVPRVRAMETYDDGTGPALYVTGMFDTAGGSSAGSIARWDGSSWSTLGFGLVQVFGMPEGRVMATFRDADGGTSLYVAGDFDHVGAIPADGFARWDGAAWHAIDVPAGLSGLDIDGLSVVDDGGGEHLYVTGRFSVPQGDGVVRFDGNEWLPVGGGLGPGGDASEGVGLFEEQLYFSVDNTPLAAGVARWDSGVTSYGVGDPGAGGRVPNLTTNGQAPLAGQGFELVVTGGLGGASAILFTGTAADAAPQPWGTLLVGGAGAAIGLTLGGVTGVAGDGTASVAVSLPANPLLQGSTHFQAIITDPASSGGFSHTQGLRLEHCGQAPVANR